MRVRIPPGTLNVICKEVKVRTIDLWGAELSTNIRSVFYYAVCIINPSNKFFDILNDLADAFAEIEKHSFRVDKASVIKRKNSVEIIATNSKNLGYKTMIMFTTCKKCGRHLFPNRGSVILHGSNCPYQIVADIIES